MRAGTARWLAMLILAVAAVLPLSANAQLVTGLQGALGSTVGPDGALYATENLTGSISRIDPATGDRTQYATGLPPQLPWIGFGGAFDVVFLDGVAYALVITVDFTLGGTDVSGIYRMDGPASFTPIADLGAFALANPPATPFFVPTGVPYSFETYRGGFLVADGHHNRILQVTLDGEITEYRVFGNIVPTGLEVRGNTVFMAQAGPVPHFPEDGKVLALTERSDPDEIASGAMLAVDVEFGLGQSLYVLAQGVWDGVSEGSPALPETGFLARINGDGSLTTVAENLNQPTSMEFIGNDAYIVTLGGEVWVLEDVGQPPFPPAFR